MRSVFQRKHEIPIRITARFSNVDATNPLTVSKEYIGTGAYYIDKWVDGDSVTLKAFKDYWAGVPQIKTINVRFMSDASVAMMELETGGIDMLDTPSWPSVDSVMSGNYDGQIKYTSNTDLYLHQLFFNSSKESPFEDLRVRQAAVYALDRDAINYGAFEGLGDTAWTIISKTFEGVIDYSANWPYKRDLDKAKALLTEAGYPNGFDAVILNYGDQNDVLANQIIANQLKEVGINLTIGSYDTATWISILTEQPDAWDLAFRLYGGSGTFSRWMAITIPQMTHVKPETPHYSDLYALANKALATLDGTERQKVEKEIQDRYLSEWMYTYPIMQKIQYVLYADNLQGVQRYGYYWFILDAYFD